MVSVSFVEVVLMNTWRMFCFLASSALIYLNCPGAFNSSSKNTNKGLNGHKEVKRLLPRRCPSNADFSYISC